MGDASSTVNKEEADSMGTDDVVNVVLGRCEIFPSCIFFPPSLKSEAKSSMESEEEERRLRGM